MKRVAIYTVIVLATLTAVLFLWQFRSVLALFFLSLALASTARPVITRLVHRGLPLWLAILLTYVLGIALAVGLLLLLGPPLVTEVQNLTSQMASAYERTWLGWMNGTDSQKVVAARLPPPSDIFAAIAGPNGEMLAQRIFDLTASMTAVIGGFIVALMLSVYWTVDQARFERLWLSLLPASQRGLARQSWQAIDSGVGAYIRSEVVQSFVGIVLLYAGYRLIGLPYPALLALLGGIAWLVPLIGVVFTIVPVLAVGLMEGVALGITAVVYTVTVLLVLEWLVEPHFFNRRRYSSILTVLLMLILIEDFGILGLIMAPPLSAAIQIFSAHWLSVQKAPALTGAASQLTDLRRRLAEVEAALQNREDRNETPSPEIVNVAARLDKLLNQADLIVDND
jgi:putative permease